MICSGESIGTRLWDEVAAPASGLENGRLQLTSSQRCVTITGSAIPIRL